MSSNPSTSPIVASVVSEPAVAAKEAVPAINEPVVDESAIKEPAIEGATSNVSEPAVAANEAGPAQAALDDTVVNEPAVKEPVIEETPVAEPTVGGENATDTLPPVTAESAAVVIEVDVTFSLHKTIIHTPFAAQSFSPFT